MLAVQQKEILGFLVLEAMEGAAQFHKLIFSILLK
jgi:hypothetical protein